YLRCVPNMVVATPSNENEARLLLSTCYQHDGPASVRYPRGSGCGAEVVADLEMVAIGKARLLLEGKRIAILGFGTLTMQALPVAEQLNATLVDMRFVNPIDKDLLKNLAQSHDAFVTIEDAAIMGGAGSAVAELFHQEG